MRFVPFSKAVSVMMLFTLAGACTIGRAESAAPDNAALDYAFRFAAALGPHDETDAGRAQAGVLVDYLNLGLIDEAARRVDQIVDWRRGTVYADIATSLVNLGRTNDALGYLKRAESFQDSVVGERGFEKARIATHIGLARMAMGTNDDAVAEILAQIPLEERVKFPPRTIRRTSPAEFEDTLEALKATPRKGHIDISAGLAESYLALMESPAVGTNSDRRAQVMVELRALAATQPLQLRAPYLERAAGILAAAGDHAGATQLLSELESAVRRAPLEIPETGAASITNHAADLPPKKIKYRAVPPGGEVLAPILASVAVAFHQLGNPDHALELLKEAEAMKPHTADLVDGLQGRLAVAAGYVRIGRVAQGMKIYREALGTAAGFVNARPRSMAIAGVCRSIAQQQAELDDAWRNRLDELLAGLKDPW